MIKRRSSPPKRKKLILLIVLTVVIAGPIAGLELTNTTHFLHNRKAVSGVIPSSSASKPTLPSDTKQDIVPPAPTSTTPSTPTPTPTETPKNGDTPTATPATGAAPTAPFGSFISNHTPNLDGNPAPSGVESGCNTTPGATCTITFTNTEGVVKSLASQKTDANGATYWSWDIKQAGLTVGTWSINATAELNGKTTTTTSAQKLEVRS